MGYKTQMFRIKEIDERNRVIRFDPSRHGKITGSRFYAVLGMDPFTTEFAAACAISRIYTEYEPTKYTVAGETIEPVIRQYPQSCAGTGLSMPTLSMEDRFRTSSKRS